MRWLAATAALLAASAGLIAWVYLRDRDTSGWQAQEAVLAREDAVTAVGVGLCHKGCRVRLLAQTGLHRWLIDVAAGGHRQCLEVDPNRFTISSREGDTGVTPAHCPASAATSTGAPRSAGISP